VDYTEPARTPDQGPPTDAEAEANLKAAFGDAIAWERSFDKHTDFDGKPVWIDRSTGEVHKEIPRLHPKDGTNL
jgi:hypothetical protein